MSLATTCPQCKTSFKVVPDQLKLRRGLVRCGVCRHVFSGVDHLRYVEDPPAPARAQRQPPGESGRSQAAASVVRAAPIVPAELLAQGAQPEPQDDERAHPRTAAPPHEQPVQSAAWPHDTGAQPQPDAYADLPETEQTAERVATGPGEDTAAREYLPASAGSLEGEDILGGEDELEGEGAAAREDGVAAAQTLAGGHAFIDEHAVGGEPAIAGDVTVTDRDAGAGDTITRWPEEAGSGGETLADVDAQAPAAPAPDADAEADRGREALIRLRMRASGSPFRDTLPIADTQADQGSAREWLETARSSLAAGPAEEDAVDFFASHRRARGFSTRSSVFAAATAVVLAIALVVQLAVGARDWLAARVPAMRPLLAAALAPAGLAVRAPRAIDALTIESFELQSAGGEGMLSMSALLRNAAGHAVRWPAMELSLTDGGGATVVRKVLLPEDYLGAAARESDAIGPDAEWAVRVALQADGVQATAYSVKLFYP